MGKETKRKKYVIISGFNTRDNNRGTAALGYGSINFCIEHNYLHEGQNLLNIKFVKKFWKYQDYSEVYESHNKKWERYVVHVWELERILFEKFHLLLPFTKFGRAIINVELVACINGGDGFSDIYGIKTFHNRLWETKLAMAIGIPVIQLPQTLGPFSDINCYELAKQILTYSKVVYVRDTKYLDELKKMGVSPMLKKDLSAYMQPQPWDIEIKSDAIGINVSGLTYSNKFHTLSGQFEAYPKLIKRLICHFRDKGHTVYLIPHSYNYQKPDVNNDDLVACRAAYESLEDKMNIVIVDKDLISPQVKYVISKMFFFIGTRMHANFAAIYTGVPLFGLAYSYKFEGAFNANGLNGAMQTTMINNVNESDIDSIIAKIDKVYMTICLNKD